CTQLFKQCLSLLRVMLAARRGIEQFLNKAYRSVYNSAKFEYNARKHSVISVQWRPFMFLQSTEAQELASRSAAVLHLIDTWRLEVNRQLDARRKVELGQFLTPMPVAQ